MPIFSVDRTFVQSSVFLPMSYLFFVVNLPVNLNMHIYLYVDSVLIVSKYNLLNLFYMFTKKEIL